MFLCNITIIITISKRTHEKTLVFSYVLLFIILNLMPLSARFKRFFVKEVFYSSIKPLLVKRGYVFLSACVFYKRFFCFFYKCCIFHQIIHRSCHNFSCTDHGFCSHLCSGSSGDRPGMACHTYRDSCQEQV